MSDLGRLTRVVLIEEAMKELGSIRDSISGGSLGFANPDEDRQAVRDYTRHAELIDGLVRALATAATGLVTSTGDHQ